MPPPTHTLYARNPVGSQNNDPSALWRAGLSTQILVWIGVVSGLLVTAFLFLWRYNRVTKKHLPSLRAIFLPTNLNMPWAGITPVPPRPPVVPGSRPNMGRSRRSRRVVGEEIGSGGRRLGQRDEDDDIEAGSVVSLPEYKASSGLPDYQEAWNGQDRTTRTDGDEVMMSVDEYERHIRAGGPTQEMTQVSATANATPLAQPNGTTTFPPLAAPPLVSNLTQHSSAVRIRQLLRLPEPVHPSRRSSFLQSTRRTSSASPNRPADTQA